MFSQLFSLCQQGLRNIFCYSPVFNALTLPVQLEGSSLQCTGGSIGRKVGGERGKKSFS